MEKQFDAVTVDEEALLDLFRRYGRDGRAITLLSLTALSPLRSDRPRFAAAVRGLVDKGMITPCGLDLLTQKPQGYRMIVAKQAVTPPMIDPVERQAAHA